MSSDQTPDARSRGQQFARRLRVAIRWRSNAAHEALMLFWAQRLFSLVGNGFSFCRNGRQLRALRRRESGKRIFIVANGPSLNRTDVDKLCGEVSIASNAIFLLFEKKQFRPTYYTIEDYLVAEDRGDEAAAMKGVWKLFPEDVMRFIPRDEQTIYINFLRGEYPGFPRFTDAFQRCVYWGGTVSFMNLQLAYYLGASKIYLIGFDHNYAPPSAQDNVKGSVITSAVADVNHFDARYFGAGYRWHDPNIERMERAYLCAKRFLDAKGVQVFNATHGGALEVFPRVDYDLLFE